MEPIQSSSHADEATLLGETSCPLKVTEDIWFRCCSCTYVTRDQHGINVHVLCECEDDNEEDTTFERFRTLTTSMQWGTEVEVVG
ncbi:gastrula zinc finger protein XlCGF7.1 [Ixodes scapularis]